MGIDAIEEKFFEGGGWVDGEGSRAKRHVG